MKEPIRKYTFDSFSVGESNRFAWGAAREVAENPGKTYNPLLLHGEVGLGKSHLLHAVGNYVLLRDPAKKVVLLGNDELRRIKELDQAQILDSDLLLVDDIEALSGEDERQVRFLNLLQSLLSREKQIVLTCDRPVEELSLSPVLLSRILGGLAVEIALPDRALKLEILKAKSKGRDVPPDVLEEIARREITTVSELEGMLNRVLAYSAFTSTPLSSSLLRGLLDKSKAERVPEQPSRPRGMEFTQLVSELKEDLSQAVVQVEEESRLREEYKQKMYIWEMKGFDVSRLRRAFARSVEEMSGEFLAFTNDVQQLIELQRRYGSLDTKLFPEEMRAIEDRLFNPDLFAEVERDIRALAERIGLRQDLISNLVPGCTLASFIIGKSNMDSFMECKKVANLEDEPRFLVVTGGQGVGKTHLLNGIAHALLETHPRTNIFYLLPDRLLKEIRLTLSRRAGFLQKYAEVDLFLMDAVDSLTLRGEEEALLVTILRGLFLGRKRVVVTSRKGLGQFSEGLREVLSGGVLRTIGAPDHELRVELLTRIASDRGLKLSDGVAELLANRVEGSFQVLKDSLARLLGSVADSQEVDRELIFRIFPARREEVAPKEVPVEAAVLAEAETQPSEEAPLEEAPPALEQVRLEEVVVAAQESGPLSLEIPSEETPLSIEKPEDTRPLKEKTIEDWPLFKDRLIDEY